VLRRLSAIDLNDFYDTANAPNGVTERMVIIMTKKTLKMLVTIVCFVLTLTLIAPVASHANEMNGEGYEVDKALLKKLKKNAIKNFPDPDSKVLTWGYAAYKIKTFLEGDENAYLETGVNRLKFMPKISISGGTKKQRKALKWCIDMGIVSNDEAFYDHSKKGIKTEYNASQKITRWQLVDLVSRVMGCGYGSRIPYLNKWEKGFTWNPKEEWILDEYDCQCIDKCVMYITPSHDLDIYLHLDDEMATRDDLSRCLKNLKLIAAADFTAKVIYRDKPLKAYTHDNYLNDLQEIKEFLEENGLEYVHEKGTKDEFRIKATTSDKKFTTSIFAFNEQELRITLEINGGHGIEQYYQTKYDNKKVDTVETFKELISKRG
jgi:hypothetical protein